MTPIRETIARAICEETNGCAAGGCSIGVQPESCLRRHGGTTDAVLRALDEAGLVVVPKELPDAVAWAICPVVQDEAGFVCKQCPATFEYKGKRCAMGCRRSYADIYRAMIAAAPSTAPDVVG